MQTIQVEIKNVYGNKMIYPVCETAHLLAKMANQRSLTPSSIITIKALGYKIEIVQKEEALCNLLGI